jgi:hypothetical protein
VKKKYVLNENDTYTMVGEIELRVLGEIVRVHMYCTTYVLGEIALGDNS